jgi:hypothetical protein
VRHAGQYPYPRSSQVVLRACWPSVAVMGSVWRVALVSPLQGLRKCALPSAPEKSRCCSRPWTARKIRALARDLPLAAVLTAAEMGAVFGRDNVVHVGLGAGRLCRRLVSDAEKLAGFRSDAAVDRGLELAAARLVRQDDSIGSR